MYGFRGLTITGEIVDKKGYKTRSRLRVTIKKLNLVFKEWYEYEIDQNGFRIIAKNKTQEVQHDKVYKRAS